MQTKETINTCIDGGSKIINNNSHINVQNDNISTSEYCKAVQRKSSIKRVTFAPDVQVT